VKERDAIRELVLALAERGYDAIAIRCKAGDDEEFRHCTAVATEMQKWTANPIAHLARESRDTDGTPFCMTIWQPF
jgi:hypothetical protein